MIVSLNEESKSIVGNKAKNLMILKKAGFSVPDGWVLTGETFSIVLRQNDLEDEFESIIKEFNKENIKLCSHKFAKLFTKLILPESIKEEISSCLQNDKYYAVRSSAMKEDLENCSFAGQYKSFLNIHGLPQIENCIIGCYRAMFSEGVLSYLVDHGLSLENYTMAVLIQEMVDPEKSGVAFSLNPLTGDDQEIIINAGFGLGEELVSGRTKAESYLYNWYHQKMNGETTNSALNKTEVVMIAQAVLDIQASFGYPCDVEFALKGGRLFILQARPITKILYGGIKGQWTTADFKDGGVSSTVCTPYMWSLYEHVWEDSFRAFLLDSKLLSEKELERKLSRMYYGRPYWNLSMAKLAMSKVPGYKERDFDEELGVKINYQGNGEETKISIKAVAQTIRMVFGCKAVLKEQLAILEPYKIETLNKYVAYLDQDLENMTFAETQAKWYQLVKIDYLKNESIYFRQIFINMIHQTLFKDKLLKVVDKNEYLNLLSGINNISHLLPFYMLWDLSRRIVEDAESFKYWKETGVPDILRDYQRDQDKTGNKAFPQLSAFIKQYGYHSSREIDVTYPHFSEDVGTVIKQIKEYILLSNDYSPLANEEKQKEQFQQQLSVIRKRMRSKGKYEKMQEAIRQMRSMLWWREELRDLSTKFYYIIRLYTLALAKHYVKQGVLEKSEDIFYLKIGDLFAFIHGETTKEKLREAIIRNRKYYNSFRNFINENEIGERCAGGENIVYPQMSRLQGVGCNNLKVTATARVVESLADIEKLQPGDILVTKYTDTGWTSKFAILSGIVTEYGGILCHAAIVSREYGIPCIVCVEQALNVIKDGSTITLNAATGEIIL